MNQVERIVAQVREQEAADQNQSVSSVPAEPENNGAGTLADRITFSTSRSSDTLAVSVTIAVPATPRDWKFFLSEAKKGAVKNTLQLNESMAITFKRGEEPKLQWKAGKRTFIYDDVYEGIADCLGMVDESGEADVSQLFIVTEGEADTDEEGQEANQSDAENSGETSASFNLG